MVRAVAKSAHTQKSICAKQKDLRNSGCLL